MRNVYSKLCCLLCTALLLCSAEVAASAITLGDYYIVNDFGGKLLANVDGSPKLASYDSANDANYLFTAESASGDYVKLKNKATGKYLTASTSNSYSVLLSASGSGDQYYWKLESVQRFSTKIVSKKSTGKRLGCDFGNDGVYYDKSVGGLNWFSIIPSNGSGFEASRKATTTSTTFTNEYGVTERDVYCVTEDITVTNSGDKYVDLHIISSSPFDGGIVNLSNDKCWLVFENVRPSSVKSMLVNVKIGGMPAVAGTNCRIEIYMHGAVVIPNLSGTAPFVAKTSGGSFSLQNGSNGDLKENCNKAVSFILRRGSMATVASGKSGGGYSRVWVADHNDLTVTLPSALKQRVSSVWVRDWHYASKSGYGKTGNGFGDAKGLGSSWYWNWDANHSSTADIEYIPIKQHLYWPGNGDFWKAGSTAMMLFNEPEHSEQHTSSKCSCGGTIDAWKAYQNTAQFNSCGLRIGSPSATDLSYLKTYTNYCFDNAQRCDFICTHGYWTTEWDSNLSTLKGYGKGQIWITEWKYGASWTSGSAPSSADDCATKVLAILDKLEYNENVERYAYYPFDDGGGHWVSRVFWESDPNKGVSPVGHVYKNVKQHLGYKSGLQPIPNWWAPSMNAPVIQGVYLQDGKYTLKVDNSYGDNTKQLGIQLKQGSSWTTVATIDPSEYDNTTLTVAIDPALLGDSFTVKAVISSLHSTTSKESAEMTFNMTTELASYRSLADLQNLTFDYGTYVKDGVATYAKDKASGMNLSGMQTVDGWTIASENGDARAAAQYKWGSSYVLGGSGYIAPGKNMQGSSTGGGLGIVSVWTAQTQYTQKVLFPAGHYIITIPVYNSKGTGAVAKNLFGFVESGGTTHYASTTTFAEGAWTTETISLDFAGPTTGSLSLGYTAANAGSGSMPHLFIDEVRITRDGLIWPLMGDANGDGQISVTDITTLVGRLRDSLHSVFERCDVNGDGKVDKSDIGSLVELLLK